MKEFGKALDLHARDDEAPEYHDPIDIKVLGREISVGYPDSGQLTYLGMLLASEGDWLERAGGLMNFVVNLMNDDDRKFIRGALLDRRVPFGAEEIEEIIEYLMEEWSARPTEPPADSRSSRRAGGQSSTATSRRAKSTPSTSISRGTATSSTRGRSTASKASSGKTSTRSS